MVTFLKKYFWPILFLYLIGLVFLYELKRAHPDSLFWLVLWFLYRLASYVAGIWLIIDWLMEGVRRFVVQEPTKKSTDPQEMEERRRLSAHPNTGPQQLLALASEFPKEVLMNPVLPLLSLEDPAFYQGLIQRAEENLSVQELRERCAGLTGSQLRQFSADCAERALSAFEEFFPDDKRPHRMIALARLYARPIWQRSAFSWEKRRSIEAAIRFIEGGATEEEVIEHRATSVAQEHIFKVLAKGRIEEIRAQAPQGAPPGYPPYIAAKVYNAASAAISGYAFYTTREVEDALFHMTMYTQSRAPHQQRTDAANAARQQERRWQLDKLNEYRGGVN